MMNSHSRSSGASLTPLAIALLLVTLFTSFSVAHPDGYGYGYKPKTYVVKSPMTKIQKIIDKANPGDRIVIEKGTYSQTISISTPHLEIIGKPGATLVKPANPYPNFCTGLAPRTFDPKKTDTSAIICIYSKKAKLKDFVDEHRRIEPGLKPGDYLDGVSVTGLTIQGSDGLGIAIIGARNTRIYDNTLVDNDIYGALTVGSINTKISKNTVKTVDLRFIGICMDDKSDVHVTNNKISGYGIGLCVQTNGADVADNDVSNTCIGAFIDPAIVGAKVQHNYIHDAGATDRCAPFGSTTGIAIAGAKNSQVRHNVIKKYEWGISLFEFGTPLVPLTVPTGNQAIGNKIYAVSVDIAISPTITPANGNVFKKNKCKTPANICNSQ